MKCKLFNNKIFTRTWHFVILIKKLPTTSVFHNSLSSKLIILFKLNVIFVYLFYSGEVLYNNLKHSTTYN